MNANDSIDKWIGAQKEAKRPLFLSVVVPAFNERWRLPPTLIDMVDYLEKREFDYEIIVVDDGSSDETSEMVKKFERVRDQVRLIRLPRNAGKGHAVRTGVLNAKGAHVIFADADGSTPIAEIDKLLDAIKNGADIAIGSRALSSDNTTVKTVWYRKLLGRSFNYVVNVILLPGIADTQCGFKMFTAKAAEFLFSRQKSDGFSFDVEILFIAQRAGLKIEEIPINWENVPGSKVSLILDALRMFRDVFRFKVMHRNITRELFR